MLIGPNWSNMGPIRRILSHVTTSEYIFWLTFRSGHYPTFSYSDECRTKKAFKYVAAFSCCGKEPFDG